MCRKGVDSDLKIFLIVHLVSIISRLRPNPGI